MALIVPVVAPQEASVFVNPTVGPFALIIVTLLVLAQPIAS